jgi:spore coat protein CotH
MESEFKVFVVHSIDNATVQAQNKLLKTVEEAPKNVVFLFDAVNQQNVLQTIKSRTQEIKIKSFTQKTLEQEDDYAFLIDMLKNMNSTKQTLKYAVKFAEKSGFLKRLEVLANIFERVLYQKLLFVDYGLMGVAENYKEGAIGEILGCITQAKQQFLANVSTNLIADTLLIKILEVRYKWNR